MLCIWVHGLRAWQLYKTSSVVDDFHRKNCLPFDIDMVFSGIYLLTFLSPVIEKIWKPDDMFNFPSTIKGLSSETVQIKIWVIAFRCFRFLACLCHQRRMIYNQCLYYHLGLLSSDPQELLRGGGRD